MNRSSAAAAGIAIGLATAAIADDAEPTSRSGAPAACRARAGAETECETADAPPKLDRASQPEIGGREPRGILTAAFAEQRAVVERAAVAVGDKLAVAAAIRAARARAAYKALRADSASSGRGRAGAAVIDGPAPGAEARELEPALAIARRRAAVRWLMARDRAELVLLVEEASHLLAARQRLDRDAERARTVALPSDLVWPVRGAVARRFGPYQHDKSGATLTRRGIDLEVEPDAAVVAPAAGTVRFAGAIRGLDHGVIIDHGEFLTVIAKLAAPAVRVGDRLAQGAALGHPARRRVYLEIRVEVGPGGTPIDPETILP